MLNRWCCVGALALTTGLLFADKDPEPAEAKVLIARIQKIGREGAGNAEASAAWKALVAQGPSALIPILAAIKEEEPVAANWLRPAFEAIAEKALGQGQLSKDALEKFLSNKAHDGTARRIAYEWLVKLDKTAPDRLLPGMLQDPSSELRRDAVARLIKQAESELQKKDEQAARTTLQRALTGACDPEQVDTIAKSLEPLGVKVDKVRHFGLVVDWYLMGPFDHSKGIGWDIPYGPEKEKQIDLRHRYKGKEGAVCQWVPHTSKDPNGVVDLNKALGKHKGSVAYAYTLLDSPKDQIVELRAGCINGLKIFLNGKEVFAREEYHHGMRIDQYAARVKLHKGSNSLLLKVCQNEQKDSWAQEWKFQLRVCQPVGSGAPFTPLKALPLSRG